MTTKSNNSFHFKISSCTEQDYQEQQHITSNPYLSRGENTEADENRLDLYKCASNETVLINTSHENELMCIAPVEVSVPVPFSHDLFCEELGHSHLFSYGKSGYQIKRQVQLS